MKKYSLLLLLFMLAAILTGCGNSPQVIHDLSNSNFQLVNQDSALINFPSGFEDQYLIVGFIYTHCPDICNVITAKMKNISTQLQNATDVHFVEITFDPARDTPTVLKNYMQNFKLDDGRFTMLTGDSASVNSVLNAMDIDAAVAYRDTTAQGKINYTMNHTNRIFIMDKQGRARFEYPGSAVPKEHVIEDLNKLR